jgi:hypothetical protein
MTEMKACEDCEARVAILGCSDCDMDFCQGCSDELHKAGTMKTHEDEGFFTHYFSSAANRANKCHAKKDPPQIYGAKHEHVKVTQTKKIRESLSFFEQQGLSSNISLGFLDFASRPLSSAFEQALTPPQQQDRSIFQPLRHPAVDKSEFCTSYS